MVERTIIENDLETPALELIACYQMGYLSKIKTFWLNATAVRVPDGSRPDTLRAVIQSLDQEVRAFETAYQRAKGAHMQFSSLKSMPIKAVEAI